MPAVVLVHQKGMKEPGCLATRLDSANARQVVDLYSRRFLCEETFRDVKDLRFGMGLSTARVKSPERRDRLLFELWGMAVPLTFTKRVEVIRRAAATGSRWKRTFKRCSPATHRTWPAP